MRLLLLDHLQTARASLRRTRSRTFLTVLGIAIGIASITAILALGNGMAQIINRQITDVGNTIAVVRPKEKVNGLLDLANPTPQNAYATSPLTEKDVTDIEAIKNVQTVAPLMTITAHVKSSDSTPPTSSVLATTPEFTDTMDLPLSDGQFIDQNTIENTAVIGRQLALDLFNNDNAVGKIFSINGQRFTVIGVLKKQDNPLNYSNVDFEHAAIISLTSGKLLNQGIAQIQQLNVKAKPDTNMTSLQQAIDSRLKETHSEESVLGVLVGEEIATPTSQTLQIINIVMAAIAGISLLVGGVGVMNSMLIGVAERTREIGLRKAVGASNRSIVTQFMIESVMLGLLGGTIGYLSGYAFAFVVSLFLPYNPALTWEIAALAAGLSVGVGTLFGVYPAYKAAKKHPIESLRRLH